MVTSVPLNNTIWALSRPSISEVFANSPFFISADVSSALESRKYDDYKEVTVPAGKTHENQLDEPSPGNGTTIVENGTGGADGDLVHGISWEEFVVHGISWEEFVRDAPMDMILNEMLRCNEAQNQVMANADTPADALMARKHGAQGIGLCRTEHMVSLLVESINSYIAWDFSLIQGKMTLDIGFSVEYTSPSGDKTMILPYRRYEVDQGNFCTIMAGNYRLIWDNSYSAFFKKAIRYKVDCIPPVVEPMQSTV